jgi:hypothetical protein
LIINFLNVQRGPFSMDLSKKCGRPQHDSREQHGKNNQQQFTEIRRRQLGG